MQGFDKTASVAQIVADLHIDPLQTGEVGDLWDSFADKANVYPRLQDWYTRRQVSDNLIGGVWNATNWKQADVEESNSDWSKNLQAQRALAHSEIMKLEGHAVANTAPAVGQMTATAPVMATSAPPSMGPYADGNFPSYRGDPRYPRGRGY